MWISACTGRRNSSVPSTAAPSGRARGGAHLQEQSASPFWLLQVCSQPPLPSRQRSMGKQTPILLWPPNCRPGRPPASARPEVVDKRPWPQQGPAQCQEPEPTQSGTALSPGGVQAGPGPGRSAAHDPSRAGGPRARARTSWKPSRHWQVKLPGSLMQIWSHDAMPSAHSSTSWQSTPSPRQPAAGARALGAGRGERARRRAAACSWACVTGG